METDAPIAQHQPQSDLLAFISGLLLGNDLNVRSWIAQYIKAGQKVRQKRLSCAAQSFSLEFHVRIQEGIEITHSLVLQFEFCQ